MNVVSSNLCGHRRCYSIGSSIKCHQLSTLAVVNLEAITADIIFITVARPASISRQESMSTPV
jgi:hypothetical protein